MYNRGMMWAKKIILILALTSIPNLGFSKFLRENQSDLVDRCYLELSQHPLVDFFVRNQGWNLEEKDSTTATEMNQKIQNYCLCRVERGDTSIENSKTLLWGITDRKMALEIQDSCANDSFAEDEMEVVFTAQFLKFVRGLLRGKINHRYPASLTRFANQDSVYEMKECLESAIIQKCTKIKSLSMSYDCVNRSIGEARRIQEFESGCPGLIHQGQDHDLDFESHPQI